MRANSWLRVGFWRPLALLSAVALLVGCGGDSTTVPVKGKVLYNGEPVTKGRIMFHPVELPYRPAQGYIQPDGTFKMSTSREGDGVVCGEHRVSLRIIEREPYSHERVVDFEPVWLVPKRYGRPETSGLTVDIDEPTDDLLIELTD